MNSRIVSFLGVFSVLAAGFSTASADTFKIDPVHSQVIFQISHMGVSKNFGRFNTLQGTFVTDDDASKVAFDAKVAVDSVDTGNAQRDKHLKTPDFFNAKQFPEITFKSTGVKKDGDNYEVTGDLTLHGVTKSIIITLAKYGQADMPPAMGGGTRAGFGGQWTIKRSDYGMNAMQGPVGDDVSLWINLEGTKQ